MRQHQDNRRGAPCFPRSLSLSSSSFITFFLFLISASSAVSIAVADDDVSVVAHPSKIVLPPGRVVEGSPGARPGAALACNRVHIHGFSRLRHPSKYPRALKVRVSVDEGDALFRIQTVEICFHKNMSIGVGMCSSGQWQKLSNTAWVKSMSPYEHRILDIRMPPDPSRSIEVSTEEEFLVHRLVFLVVGILMMAAAHSLSESVVFYYGGAMTLGIIVVMLVILFQGMRLLPTGRKSSLAIFVYSSILGVGTFLLSYLSGLLQTILVEIGISEDMHYPLVILLLVCLVLAGAWFGYWGVRKFVLTEEGSVDSSVAYFVEWATLILSAVLILQSSLDTLFAAEILGLTISMVAITKQKRLRYLRHIFRRMSRPIRRRGDELWCAGRRPTASPEILLKDNHSSTFHHIPGRRRYSREEWDAFTKEQTRKGLTELASTPEFQRWASQNVERLHLTPDNSRERRRRRRLFPWWV
ncbi:hypothetical protein OPV22_009003 [Ensete ventricosum]|uniref:Magnesium transporter n=1 Tax=Ensete ventricosum TaxID=4639 RepID=A0AAV8R7V4_ENSVE|nr:hypothetical protein OPV22_009003 [Ensete ventricosum]